VIQIIAEGRSMKEAAYILKITRCSVALNKCAANTAAKFFEDAAVREGRSEEDVGACHVQNRIVLTPKEIYVAGA
jgi:hypothetical protein